MLRTYQYSLNEHIQLILQSLILLIELIRGQVQLLAILFCLAILLGIFGWFGIIYCLALALLSSGGLLLVLFRHLQADVDGLSSQNLIECGWSIDETGTDAANEASDWVEEGFRWL